MAVSWLPSALAVAAAALAPAAIADAKSLARPAAMLRTLPAQEIAGSRPLQLFGARGGPCLIVDSDGADRAMTRRFALSGRRVLVLVDCQEGGRNPRTFAYQQDRPGAPEQPLNLPGPAGRRSDPIVPAEGLANAVFDFDTGVLRSYRYLPGGTDCGTFRAWGYTRRGWRMIEERRAPRCTGLRPDQWPQTYHVPAVVDRGGTDGLP